MVGSAGALTVDPMRGSMPRHQPSMSPTSSSARMTPEVAVIVGGGGDSPGDQQQRHSARKATDEDFNPAVDDLISKLPDVLFPFEGDSGDDELTPFKAVYGSSPGNRSPARGSANPKVSPSGHSNGRGSGVNGTKTRLQFGSAPAGGREHTFGGRELESPMASPPSRPARNSSGGSGKYQPPNRRGGGGNSPSSYSSQSRSSRGKQQGGGRHNDSKPVKKNPATPGFNGAGFRSIREIYVSKVHAFLCARAIEGTPWVKLSGKGSVAAACEKPLTVPENYTQFFKDHAVMFELSPDGRYVAAKLPGEEHACIPPPPMEGSGSNSSGSPSLSSSPAGTNGLHPDAADELRVQEDGFLTFSMPPPPHGSSPRSPQRGRSWRAGRALQVADDGAAPGRSPSPGAKSSSSHSSGDSSMKEGSSRGGGAGKVCMYLSRPGGCRAGDSCRFSHALPSGGMQSLGKPPKSPAMKIVKKLGRGDDQDGGFNVALPLPA